MCTHQYWTPMPDDVLDRIITRHKKCKGCKHDLLSGVCRIYKKNCRNQELYEI